MGAKEIITGSREFVTGWIAAATGSRLPELDRQNDLEGLERMAEGKPDFGQIIKFRDQIAGQAETQEEVISAYRISDYRLIPRMKDSAVIRLAELKGQPTTAKKIESY